MNPSSERVGRYQLLEPIGVGPCGTVSRAKVFGVAGFERQFAVKRFHQELTITSTLASALSAAARAYGSLEHPRIARMSEFGVAQGVTFTAVELVAGLDAARLGAEAKLAGQPLAAGGALALISQAARAVGYAHGRGLTHLGLAPTNVIVTADGDVKITDFGILAAGLPQRPVDVARLVNRVQYLAPEQVANEATSAATDVFALGVIAYELVTGQRTFKGDSPQQIAQAIMNGPPPEPPLPRPIVRVLHRCLARSPFERFPDARALADALDAALRVAPVPGTRKDVGAQVKATMDRLAELNANEMSGMVALHVGTGPIPRADAAALARESDQGISTANFLRVDDMTGPAPLSPAATMPDGPRPVTTMAGIAPPPIPVPPGISGPTSGSTTRDNIVGPPPGATLLGISKPAPKIPSIPPRAGTSQPIPSIVPRTPTSRLPTAGAVPPAIPHVPSGRIEIDPPPAFDPPVTEVSMVELFDEDGPVRGRDATTQADPEQQIDQNDIVTSTGVDAVDSVPREVQTREMSAGFVDRLREEASRNSAESLSVQMEVVQPPERDSRADIDPAASAAANASFAAALHEASGVFPRPQPTPPVEEPPASGPLFGEPAPAPAPSSTLFGVAAPSRPGTNTGTPITSPGVSGPVLRAPSSAGITGPVPRAPSSAGITGPVPRAPANVATGPLPSSPPLDESPRRPTPDPTAPLEPPPVTLAARADAPAPQIRMTPAPGAAEIPPLPATPSSTAVVTQRKSNVPLAAGLVVALGVLGVVGYLLYQELVAEDDTVAVAQRDAGASADATAVAETTADAAVTTVDAAAVVATVDASAVAAVDASAVAAVVDAAVAVDAAVVADAAVAVVDAQKPTPTGSANELAITSTPPGAHVFLDGSDVGQTPVKLAASNDRHTVALLLPGHELYIAEVDGKGTFAIPLKEVTPTGGPAGIKVLRCKDKERYYVFVDGKPTGQLCPTERIDTEVGPHTVEVYDAVSESRKKWDIEVKDTRLSVRVKIE